jgi:hypothetical protein
MSLCKCGKPVERFCRGDGEYSKCNSCWTFSDPRYIKKVKAFVDEMTEVARKFDLVIAEASEAIPHSYDPQFGAKLFWDSKNRRYLIHLPSGEEIT